MIYYILSIIIDIILVPLGASSIPMYISGNADIPLSMVISFTLMPIACLIISVIGLKKRTCVSKAVLLKLSIIFAFAGISFLGMDEGIYALVLFEAVAAVFLIAFVIRKHHKNNSTKNATTGVENIKKREFSYKGEYAWDDAAAEYLRKTGKKSISELTEEENDLIYDYSMMPFVYYFYWLLDQGYMSSEFYELVGAGLVEDCRNGYASPMEILRNIDYTIDGSDMLDGALQFTFYYFEATHLQLYSKSFIFDYWDEIANGNNFFYAVDFDWDTAKKLYKRIDEADADWYPNKYNNVDYYEDDETYPDSDKVIHSKRFNTDLAVFRQGIKEKENITDEYIAKCAADIDCISDEQFDRLDRWISEDYGDMLRGRAVSELRPMVLHVFEPRNEDDIVYAIGGEAEYEDEHGIAVYVRNGIIYRYGYGYDLEDPYSDECERQYRLANNPISFIDITTKEQAEELVRLGELVKTRLLPEEFGGTEDETNIIYITREALREKEKMDRRLRALINSWAGRLKFQYKAHYYDGGVHVIPQAIYVYHDKAAGQESAFSFNLQIWL